jgi:two-component sensor histidine kinase
MTQLSKVFADHTVLGPEDRDWLAALIHEWQLLADVSFSDLVLWLPDEDDNVFWAAAQRRPDTGPTALEDDVVGESVEYDPEHPVTDAYLSREISETSDNQLNAGIPVDVWAIPIIRHDQVIAIVERHTNRMGVRAPGALEDAYLEVAGALTDMLWHGDFPIEPPSAAPLSPKVGDGLMRLDPQGIVKYASPNAVTAYRRLGLTADLVGEDLKPITEELGEISLVASGPKYPDGRQVKDVNVELPHAMVRLRFIPLIRDGANDGAVALCVDATAIRDRDRELITKDATIREIHHRVKNNLQTVAALLRMQSRRMHSPEAKGALRDAMSRVQSIAVVHEMLSQNFDETVPFDQAADQLVRMVADVSTTSGTVTYERKGSFGRLPAEIATSLSLAVTELCQNAVEHGMGSGSGTIIVTANNDGHLLKVVVANDGEPLPEGFAIGNTRSLGLSIVRTLVEDLHGKFSVRNEPSGHGVEAIVTIPLTDR